MLTLQQLEALFERWQAAEALIVDRLRPGLTDRQMDDALAPLGLTLPTEARTWWGWHDGAPMSPEAARGTHEIGPDRPFVPLEQAVADYRSRMSIALEMEPDVESETVWRREWFPITSFGDVACDCLGGEGEPTPIRYTNYHRTDDPERAVADSFGGMVELWIEAIESGAWRYDRDDNRWRVDFGTRSEQLERTFLV